MIYFYTQNITLQQKAMNSKALAYPVYLYRTNDKVCDTDVVLLATPAVAIIGGVIDDVCEATRLPDADDELNEAVCIELTKTLALGKALPPAVDSRLAVPEALDDVPVVDCVCEGSCV